MCVCVCVCVCTSAWSGVRETIHAVLSRNEEWRPKEGTDPHVMSAHSCHLPSRALSLSSGQKTSSMVVESVRIVCRHSDASKPSQVKSSQVKSSQVKSGQIRPSQAKPSQIKPSQVKSSHVMSSHVKSSQVMSCQVMSSQVKLIYF